MTEQAPVILVIDDQAQNLQILSTTLRAADNDLILRTVRALHGNISKTAEQLGVSRGLVYRRLREAMLVADQATPHAFE